MHNGKVDKRLIIAGGLLLFAFVLLVSLSNGKIDRLFQEYQQARIRLVDILENGDNVKYIDGKRWVRCEGGISFHCAQDGCKETHEEDTWSQLEYPQKCLLLGGGNE